MTVARILPGRLPRRFATAPRATARTPAASFEVVVAETFGSRLWGLAGLGDDQVVPLLFPRCRSLHTFGMRLALDIVWLDPTRGGEVVSVERAVRPRRLVSGPRRVKGVAALELPAGDAEALGLVAGGRVEVVRP